MSHASSIEDPSGAKIKVHGFRQQSEDNDRGEGSYERMDLDELHSV